MILCKIKNDEKTVIVQLEDYLIDSENSEVVFPTETILRNNGFVNGHFQLTYYLLSPWKNSEFKVYNDKLTPIKFSKNRIQAIAVFKNYPNLITDQNIKQFQTYYQANKTKIKLLSFANNKTSIIQHLKFNFFNKQYVIRFSEPTEYTTKDSFYLYVMKYQPITEEYDLLPLVQYQPTSYITLREPKFFDTDISSNWVISQSYESLTTFTQSDYNIPLSINNALETIYYDINDTNSFVHFGTYQSRLNSFAKKYIDLLSISQRYISTSKVEKIQELIKNFNTFQRHCLLDLNLITTGSESSILEFANPIQFNEWYQTKSDFASICDKNNIHALYKLLPENILYDEENVDLIQFVNLLGDTLDEFWAGIKNLTSINSLLEVQLQNFSFNYLIQVLRNYGIMYERGFRIETLNKIFFQSSLLNRDNIEINHYNKILLVRLLANIPFLLKSKGSRHCIQQLYNIFGLSEGLLKIHQFVKDSYSGENTVRITKPYFSCSSINTMSFINNSDAKVVLIYARFPIVPSSNTLLELNNVSIGLPTYELKKPYLLILEKYGESEINFSYYVEQELSNYTKLYSNTNIDKISIVGECSVDNVKFLKQTMSDYSIYAKGTNIIDSINNVYAIFNFNQLYPNQLENSQITCDYNTQALKIQTFETIKYSSIFSLGNTPSKFYRIAENQPIQLPKPVKVEKIVNYPNVHFGSVYSDYYDSQFIIDYQNKLDFLLDNNEYKNFKKLYKYKKLEDYKMLYSNYFNIFTTSYTKMVDFYENLDSSFYTILQQFIPYSLNAKYGVILNNNILTRNKIPTMELISTQPVKTPSTSVQLTFTNFYADEVETPSTSVQLTFTNFYADEVAKGIGNIYFFPKIIGNSCQSQSGLLKINFTGISGMDNNYGKGKLKVSSDEIWNIKAQASYKIYRYQAYTTTIKMFKYKIRAFVGQAKTSTVAKQRKLIIDQDKNLKITKINI